MSNELVNIEKEYGVSKSRADEITNVFAPMTEMLRSFEKDYDEVVKEADEEVTKEVIVKAKRLRLDIRKVRTTAEKAHKETKSEALRWGKAIDGVKNILKYAVEEKENNLKKIEEHFENIERERMEKLQRERENALIELEMEVKGMQFGDMPEPAWEVFLAGAKDTYNKKKEAEKKAEEDRIAQEKKKEEERKRIEEENEKLKKQQEKMEKEAEKIRKKSEAEKKKLEAVAEKARKERKKEAEKARKKQEKLEKELQEKKDAEKAKQKEINDAEKARKLAEKKAKRAPDKEKLLKFAEDLKATGFPEVKSEEAEKIINNTVDLIKKVVKYVKDNAGKL